MDYNGNPTGEEVEFAFPASFDEKGNLTTEAQAIFPAQNITIELYKDGDLIFSSEKDKNGELSAANPGKRNESTFKYSGEVSSNISQLIKIPSIFICFGARHEIREFRACAVFLSKTAFSVIGIPMILTRTPS